MTESTTIITVPLVPETRRGIEHLAPGRATAELAFGQALLADLLAILGIANVARPDGSLTPVRDAGASVAQPTLAS